MTKILIDREVLEDVLNSPALDDRLGNSFFHIRARIRSALEAPQGMPELPQHPEWAATGWTRDEVAAIVAYGQACRAHGLAQMPDAELDDAMVSVVGSPAPFYRAMGRAVEAHHGIGCKP